MADRPEMMDKSELLKELRIDREAPRRSRSRARLIGTLVAVLVLVAGGLLWFAARPAPLSVQVAVARDAGQGPGPVLDASGYVTARRQATVSAKITGKVTEVLIEEGQQVKEGDVLARLDDTEAKAQLSLSQAQLTAARSQLAEVRAQLVQAERDHDRQQELLRRQLVAEQSMDAARAQRDMVRARLGNLEEQIRVAIESVAVARVQLDNTEIRAPFSGVVVAKAAQPGEMISPISAGGGFTRTGIGTIVDMDSLEIQVDVNESFINRVSPGQPVEAVLNAYPDWKIPGEVIAIIPSADRNKATVKVRVALQAEGSAHPAGHGGARVVPDRAVGAGAPPAGAAGVLVPAAAVRVEGKAGIVFVFANDKVQRRSVTLGQSVGPDRQVLTGLSAGERVVLSPPASLGDGAAVKLASGS